MVTAFADYESKSKVKNPACRIHTSRLGGHQEFINIFFLFLDERNLLFLSSLVQISNNWTKTQTLHVALQRYTDIALSVFSDFGHGSDFQQLN